jgi:hypothetical protein
LEDFSAMDINDKQEVNQSTEKQRTERPGTNSMWQSAETPEWLSDTSEEMEQAREALLGDYNMWVQLAGGTRDDALQVFMKDYPGGPMQLGSDTKLREYLGARFPWAIAYRLYEYRTGIFNAVTFLIMFAGLGFLAWYGLKK